MLCQRPVIYYAMTFALFARTHYGKWRYTNVMNVSYELTCLLTSGQDMYDTGVLVFHIAATHFRIYKQITVNSPIKVI